MIYYFHNKCAQKPDLIKAAFRRIFIGETIDEDEIEERLKMFMMINEKIMCHQNRFFITPMEQKKLRAPYLDSSLCMSDNEDVVNDRDIMFTVNHNSVPESPPIFRTNEKDETEIGRSNTDSNGYEKEHILNMIRAVANERNATKEDYDNMRDASTLVALPGKVGILYDIICEVTKAMRGVEGGHSTLQMEIQMV